mgnify:CR=1 FL=1
MFSLLMTYLFLRYVSAVFKACWVKKPFETLLPISSAFRFISMYSPWVNFANLSLRSLRESMQNPILCFFINGAKAAFSQIMTGMFPLK